MEKRRGENDNAMTLRNRCWIGLLTDSKILGKCIEMRTCIADWMTSNLLCLNSTKTEFLLLVKPQLNKIHNPTLVLVTLTRFLL